METRKKTVINPKYQELTGFVNNIINNYDTEGKVIYSVRNEIKVVKLENIILAVKYYKRLSFTNRIIYSITKATKAKKAYFNALALIDKGINTPEPVGYADSYKYGFLDRSFFISLYTDYNSVKTIFDQPVKEAAEALQTFARFTYEVHQKGFFPGDYTLNNVRFKETENGYDFQLIDINKMKTGRFTFRKGSKNLQRLYVPSEKLGIIAAEYARQAKKDDFKTLEFFLFFRNLFLFKRHFKKLFRNSFGINKKRKRWNTCNLTTEGAEIKPD